MTKEEIVIVILLSILCITFGCIGGFITGVYAQRQVEKNEHSKN